MKKSIRDLSSNEVGVVGGGISEYMKGIGVLAVNTLGPIVGFVFTLRVISSFLVQDRRGE